MTPEEYGRLVREGWDAFNARDIDGFLATVHPDFDGRSALAATEGVRYHGLEGAREWLRNISESWSEFQGAPEQLLVLGQVGMYVVDLQMRARASEIELTNRSYFVTVTQDDRFVLVHAYLDPAESAELFARLLRERR